MDSYTHNTKPHETNSSGYRHEASSPTDFFSSAQVLAGAAMSTFTHESTKVNKSEAAMAADNLLHAASQYGHLEEKSFGKYIGKAEEYLHQYATPSSQPPSHGNGPVKKYQEEEEEYENEEHRTGHKPSYASGKTKKHQEEEYEDEEYTGHKTSAQPNSYASSKTKYHQEEEYEEEEAYASHKTSARPNSYASGKTKKHQEEEYGDEEEAYASHKTSARPNSYASGKTKKQQEEYEEEEGSGGGIGDYMKLAQGLLKSQGGGHSGHSVGGESEGGAGVGDYLKLAQGFLGKR